MGDITEADLIAEDLDREWGLITDQIMIAASTKYNYKLNVDKNSSKDPEDIPDYLDLTKPAKTNRQLTNKKMRKQLRAAAHAAARIARWDHLPIRENHAGIPVLTDCYETAGIIVP